MPEIRGLALPFPPPEGDANGVGAFRGEPKAPRSGHGEPRHLGDDDAEPTMPQPLFGAGQRGLVVTCLDIDDAIGVQPYLGQGRLEQVRPCDAPEYLAACACRDACREERSGGTINGAVTTAGDLVKRTTRQAPAGKARVHLVDSEGEYRFLVRLSAFDLLDLCAQGFDGGTGPHGETTFRAG